MKIKSLFFIFILYPYILLGQNHWVGVQGAYNFIGSSKTSKVQYERQPSYAIGVNYEWNYKNVALFGFDLLYNNFSYTNKYAHAFNDSNLVIHDTISYPSQAYHFDSQTPANFNIHFLSIPFKFGWHFGKKFRGFIIGGIGPTFALGGTVLLQNLVVNPNNETVSLKVQKGNKAGVMGQLEFGFKYIIQKKYQLFASALIYQHFLSPILKGDFYDGAFHTSSEIGNWGFNFSFGIKMALSNKPLEESPTKKKEKDKEKDIYEELYLEEE